MNVEDETSIPGYIYFRDNERDLKIGKTNDLVVRGSAYKTENPRDTVLDYFFVETYAQATVIENEMKAAAKAEGLVIYPDHPKRKEWLERIEETYAFWDRFVLKYAKKTHEEWLTTCHPELKSELQEAIDSAWKWHASSEKNSERCQELESELKEYKRKSFNRETENIVLEKKVKQVTSLKYLVVLLALCLVAPLAFQAADYLATDVLAEACQEKLHQADGKIVKVDGEWYRIKDMSVYRLDDVGYRSQYKVKLIKVTNPSPSHPLFWKCLDAQVISRL